MLFLFQIFRELQLSEISSCEVREMATNQEIISMK